MAASDAKPASTDGKGDRIAVGIEAGPDERAVGRDPGSLERSGTVRTA
jgi:hypothetical protein